MKQLFSAFIQQKALLFLAYSVVFVSFFLPNQVNSFVLILFGLVASPFALKNKESFLNKETLISLALFVMLCIGMAYSENMTEGASIVERSISLVVLPFLALSFKEVSKKNKRLLLHVFILSAFLAGLFCLGNAFYSYCDTGTAYPSGQTGHFVYNRFMHHRLSSALGIHAIYLSFYCSFAAIAVFQKVLFEADLKRVELLLNLFLFLFFALLIFLLKSSLFAFIFAVSCALLVFVRLRKQLLEPKYAFLLCLTLGVTTFFAYEGVRSKLDSFDTSFKYENETLRPLVMRIALWNSAWEVVQKQPFLGVGTGDGKDELMLQYKEVNFKVAEQGSFNAHNMYLEYWVSNGAVMVTLFLLFIFLLLVKAIKHGNFLFFAFTLYFAFFSITESTLLKQKGIVFFVFFAFLFITDPNCWKTSSRTIDEDTTSS